MAESSTVKKITVGAIATVVGGVALKLIGLLAPIGQWLATAAVTVWTTLLSTVAVPVWALIVGGTLVAVVAGQMLHGVLATVADAPGRDPELPSKPKPESLDRSSLSPIERSVLKTLREADGAQMDPTDLSRVLGVQRLAIESALDGLEDRRLVDWTDNWIYGASVQLTPKGRDLVLRWPEL